MATDRMRAQRTERGIGILLLDEPDPYPPGDPGNASSFHFPVHYKMVPGASVERVASADVSLVDAVVTAARELAADGVEAIAGCCGYFMNFQREVADAVSIPVALSSLLQVPIALEMIGSARRLGILVGTAARFGAMPCQEWNPDPSRLVVGEVIGDGGFAALYARESCHDTDFVTARVMDTAHTMLEKHPDIGALLLETTALAPYAKPVRSAFSLPVFDTITAIDFLYAITHRRAGRPAE